MDKKAGTILVVAFFVFFVGIILVNQGAVNASEARIVRIVGGETPSIQSIRLEPAHLTISPGSVVIWNNWARTYEVKIIFKEGKVCEDVTDSETGFKMDAKNCFVTTWIKEGRTTSLRFNKHGEYEYIVETPGGIKSSGEIIVR